MSKPSVLVCRAVFPDIVDRLREHFEVETNEADVVWSPAELIQHLQGKAGVFITGTQPIDTALLEACPQLEAVCSMAVGYDNVDVPACTAHGVLVSNAPGVLTETTADFGFALMKPSATLTNIARGGIVDDAALAQALRERRIAAAGLDVFEGEPAVHPDLLTVPNVVLTPHIASASVATRRAMATLAADNLIAALTGGTPPTPINPEVLAPRG